MYDLLEWCVELHDRWVRIYATWMGRRTSWNELVCYSVQHIDIEFRMFYQKFNQTWCVSLRTRWQPRGGSRSPELHRVRFVFTRTKQHIYFQLDSLLQNWLDCPSVWQLHIFRHSSLQSFMRQCFRQHGTDVRFNSSWSVNTLDSNDLFIYLKITGFQVQPCPPEMSVLERRAVIGSNSSGKMTPIAIRLWLLTRWIFKPWNRITNPIRTSTFL